MREQNAVLFDLDGTLTDPKVGITESIRYAMKKLGRKAPPADALEWCIGPPLREAFKQLLDSSDNELLDRAVALHRERFGTVGLFENTLYPQIPGVLRKLRSAGYATFVATSKPWMYAVQIIEHFKLKELFKDVYGSEIGGVRTDKGELIAYILTCEKLYPSQVVMVGDREHDVIGAKKCGVPCIGVTYGYGTEAELRDHGVKLVATSPQAIPGLVNMCFNGIR